EVRRKQRYYAERRVAVEVLDGHQVAQAEPNLRPGLAGGLRVAGDSVVYPPCAARHFLEHAAARGAVVRERAPVESLTGKGVRLKNGESISAGLVVNASGAWAPSLTPGWPVRKRKGHLVI